MTHVKDLVPDPVNRRSHNPRNIGLVVDALHAVGAARSIVIDEDNVILAGNGVTEAAAEAGITKVRVVEASGDELIAVRRSGLSAAQKRQLAIYDNRGAELATWNAEQLAADLQNGEDLSAFFLPDELTKLLGVSGVKAGRTDPDAVPEVRSTSIVAGDLFELGAHRLLCGDSTSGADVARVLGNVVPFLMVTDPPYGVDYDPEWRDRAAEFTPSMGNGKDTAKGIVRNDDKGDWTPAWQLFWGDVAYIWHADRYSADVAASLAVAGFSIRAQIIWAKSRLVFGRSHYHWQHEPCWYAFRDGRSARWCGDRNQTTLWQIDKPQKSETGHSTQKPVECMRRPIQNHGGVDDHVYEPFAGSGSTIVAAEQLGRRCFAIEIAPQYCQVIIDRWEQFTGQQAVKVGEAIHA